jgi:ureidoacrylate peracid hydrolase
MNPTSRNIPIDKDHAALLVVDVQNYSVHSEGGSFARLTAEQNNEKGRFLDQLNAVVLPNQVRLLQVCRKFGIEVIYTVIESLTLDGRDRSLDYKISGINVPKGSWDAQVPGVVAPLDTEIVIPKTSSSVFISTNIDYLLRNLGIRSLIVAGLLTDQCIDSTVRDACDLGYLVTLVTDACATHSEERHNSSLRNNCGYCRQITTAKLVEEIETMQPKS